MNFKELIETPEYDFLRENENLGENIIMLGLGGSHAYGTSNENSDVDIRGIAANSTKDLLLGRDFEQIVSNTTDTTIYSLRKVFKLFANCNPNTIELLGLNKDQILYSSPIWDKIVKNKKIFLSKRCINTFGGYASQQLRRLENSSARTVNAERREQHILNSINNASVSFKERYEKMSDDSLHLYIDKETNQIDVDINLKHYPLRDVCMLFSEYNNIVRDYDKLGSRNKKATLHNKLGKHMMHLVRLYYMAFDILENEEIITYRTNEHDLLMEIRNGKFLDDNDIPTAEFYNFLNELDSRFEKAKMNTKLPDQPDMEAIDNLFLDIVQDVEIDKRKKFENKIKQLLWN